MRERAVILLYTETYLVLVKEPSCSLLPALLTLPASLRKPLFSLLPPRNGHGMGDTGTQNTETEPCLSTIPPPEKVCWNLGKTPTLGIFPSFSHFLPPLWACFFLERGLRFRDWISRPRERINIRGEVEVKQWCRERREGITRSSSC